VVFRSLISIESINRPMHESPVLWHNDVLRFKAKARKDQLYNMDSFRLIIWSISEWKTLLCDDFPSTRILLVIVKHCWWNSESLGRGDLKIELEKFCYIVWNNTSLILTFHTALLKCEFQNKPFRIAFRTYGELYF